MRAACLFAVLLGFAAPCAAEGWTTALRLGGGWSAPASPTGAGSFVQSYASTLAGRAGLAARSGGWGLGLEGCAAGFRHQSVPGARADLSAALLTGERLFALEEDAADGPYLQLGLGWGWGAVSDPYRPGPRWSALAGKAALGYRLPLGGIFEADLEGACWGLAGESGRDGVVVAALSLGLGAAW